MIHDAFRPLEWADFMRGPDYANVILDTHPYQCFTDDDRKRDLHQQVEFALLERKKQLDAMQKQLPCIVGEWSCALPPESLEGRTGFATRRRHAGLWRCSVDQFRRHSRLVFLDVQDRGRGCVELPRLRQARLDAGEV